MYQFLALLIVIGPLIFVHEFGHFCFAKLFKIKVLKFSLGFGKKLVGFQGGETEYLIGALPLGGYVKMLGEQQGEEVPEEDEERSFSHKPVWQRFIVVMAGPISNLLFAALLFFFVFAVVGIPSLVDSTLISGVTKGSPAEQAGIKPGDTILSINGQETVHWMDMADLVSNSQGEELNLVIGRNGERLEIKARPALIPDRDPIFGHEEGKRYMLGVSRSDEVVYNKVPLSEAFAAGFTETWAIIRMTGKAVKMVINKVIPAKDMLGGPILIAQQAGRQMQAGFLSLIHFIGLVSVSLGMLNLLPIPILDGGHLMFYTYEIIFRRPLPQKVMEIALQAGLVILGTLMIFVFYNDIVRIVSGG